MQESDDEDDVPDNSAGVHEPDDDEEYLEANDTDGSGSEEQNPGNEGQELENSDNEEMAGIGGEQDMPEIDVGHDVAENQHENEDEGQEIPGSSGNSGIDRSEDEDYIADETDDDSDGEEEMPWIEGEQDMPLPEIGNQEQGQDNEGDGEEILGSSGDTGVDHSSDEDHVADDTDDDSDGEEEMPWIEAEQDMPLPEIENQEQGQDNGEDEEEIQGSSGYSGIDRSSDEDYVADETDDSDDY
ncbi:OLC1v1022725C1 [Oldenlandia corymbosa var. corymbosa]|uniref:OLC1v1022725C1 n=1 Tax=Oldenlandia corymbosa var. corymbosa TaxID=529605 RepID=A0AAV1BYG3_OLDCO|nr:OLC1v1022725C1 [Oldenlandia corymbosa var. corymbosa]